MATVERLMIDGTRRGVRGLMQLADDLRERRVELGLTQQHVASAIGVSRSSYSRIEGGRAHSLSIVRASQIGRVVGLDVVVRAYPGPVPLRDSAHAQRLARVLRQVGPPLTARTEVPLPRQQGAPPEQRAWDAMVVGSGRRISIEMEMRLRDV